MDTTKLWFDRLRIPKVPNEKAVGEYLTSKEVCKQLPKMYERGDVFGSDNVKANCYLAHKKLGIVEERLERKRNLAIECRTCLDAQWAELHSKEEELRETFVMFSGFVMENGEKRDRAAAILRDLNQANANRLLDIKQLERDCSEMDVMYRKIDRLVHKNWIYETFLSEVVDQYKGEFKNAMDVLKRYESLVYTRETLNKHQQLISVKLDLLIMEYLKKINDYCVKLEGLHVRLADLHQRYESTKTNALKWENLLLNIRSEATEKITDLTAIKESCGRMYREICERKGIEPVYMNDYVKQFDVIKKALFDYECINKMARALEEEKLVLSEKPCVSSGTEWQSGMD